MRKLLSMALSLVMIAALAVGCGSKDDSSNTPDDTAKEPTVTLKVGTIYATSHPSCAVIDEVFKPMVEEKSNGTIKIETYHDCLLGDEAGLWQSVRDGSVDIVVIGTCMNQEFPVMLISDWPFLYRDLDHATKVWTGEVGDDLAAMFGEKFPETELLSVMPNSARTFSCSKPLTCVEDFAGKKFRMPNNPIHVGIVEDLGASAQVISLADLFTALETGTVDGQDNGMVTILAQSYQEVQDYVYETNHMIAILETIINADAMSKLSENQQQIIREAAKATGEQAWADYAKSIDTDRETLTQAGVTVTPCTAENQAKIIEKIQPTLNELLTENADWAPALIEKIEAVQ